MKRSTNINQILALFVALFVATAFSACSDISGTDYDSELSSENFTQSFDKKDKDNENGTVQPYGDAVVDGKVYVCKFTRTPGSDRMELKKGNQGLVHVSANSLRNLGLEGWPVISVGDYWTDKHGKHGEDPDFSIVIDPVKGAEALANRNNDDYEIIVDEFCYEEAEDSGIGGDFVGDF